MGGPNPSLGSRIYDGDNNSDRYKGYKQPLGSVSERHTPLRDLRPHQPLQRLQLNTLACVVKLKPTDRAPVGNRLVVHTVTSP